LVLEWTGERYVPNAGDEQLWYEHAHRYAVAATLVADRVVVDVGSGEGYGPAWLARRARHVLGIDIAADAVAHASRAYGTPTLRFAVGDARRLPVGDGAAEVVTCFETIEHVSEPESVLDELRRIVAPGGVVVLSTPDRHATHASGSPPNPFHLHELTAAELAHELRARFRTCLLLGQRVTSVSMLWPLLDAIDDGPSGGEGLADVTVIGACEPTVDEQSRAPQPSYLVALCTDAPALSHTSHGSVLVDPADALLVDLRGQLIRARTQLDEWERELGARADALAAADELADNLRTTVRRRDRTIKELRSELEAGSAAWRVAEVMARRLQAEVDELVDDLAAAHSAVESSKRALAINENSLGGRLLTRYRDAVNRRLPVGSLPRTSYEAGRGVVALTLRRPIRRATSRPSSPPCDIVCPTSTKPVASLVVPVYGRIPEALACLASIAAARSRVPYEVIVVDDSTPGGIGELEAVRGLRLVRNETNLGYVASTNRGAALARGDYIVLLNSDTEVKSGWLDTLVATAERDPTVGIVGAKLVYPDGRLAEAGGIVFSDATAWNYGRGDAPDHSRYAWLREVDYCSGACVLVRRRVWEELGGFSETFTRGYWEDTDLAFAARGRGWKTVFQPHAVVTHHEGASHGGSSDPLMRLNGRRFAERWSAALVEQPRPGRVFRGRRRGPDRAVVVIDHHLPTPDRDSGSMRMHHLLLLLRDAGRHVVFIPSNRTSYTEYAFKLQQAGIEVVLADEQLDTFLHEVAPEVDLVVLSRPDVALDYLGPVQRRIPLAVIAYDMVDHHGLREQREAAVRGLGPVISMAALERRACLAADAIIAVSEPEAEAALELAPGRPVVVIPNIHDEPRTTTPHAERRGLLFIGSGQHTPNPDAVQHLVDHILPHVWRHLPGTPMHVVGDRLATELTDLPRGVIVHGWVPDLRPLLESCLVFVAPLRFGAGLKGKIGLAMAAGVPVVTTSVGAEGMGVLDGHDLLVADDPELFAKHVIKLHSDPELWCRVADAGRAHVERELGTEAARPRVADLLNVADELRSARRR
jgi:GT2 family glycosyltransferase/SAM-dependent methyltransferase/glycosyltransferase involved in cell wall biosynthesis